MKDFIQELNYRILKHIALRVELLFNDKDFEISEYDVQAFLSQFIKVNVINTGYVTHREAFGKYDCVISKNDSKSPTILYELKTFLKPKEEINRESAFQSFLKDFKKLKKGINIYKNSRGFFILICKQNQLKYKPKDKKKPFIKNLEFILDRYNGRKYYKKFSYDKIDFFIKPSRKCSIERVCALCWEIK